MKKLVFFLLALPFLGFSQGFKEHISSFNAVQTSYKHDEQWSLFSEIQTRTFEDFSEIDFYALSISLGYNFNKNTKISVGFGKYGIYKNRDFYQRENRLYIQFFQNHRWNRWSLSHRLRAEKRLFYQPKSDKKINTERYRYRLITTLPLNRDKVESQTFYLLNSEELYFAPKNGDGFLKRNEFLTALGYQWDKNISTNIGYMWQRDFSDLNGNKNYHYLYFSLGVSFKK